MKKLVTFIISSLFYFTALLNFQINASSSTNPTNTINWGEIDSDTARSMLPEILDASKIPHGDLAVPSEKAHSRRYIISQWQRIATGATALVLGKNNAGELMVALGFQRGAMNHPAGYMEVPLPKDDLTGLRKKGASRVNGTTGELVLADSSYEQNALREIHEEIGLKINEEQLQFLNVTLDLENSPSCVAVNYFVELADTPKLQTLDEEFPDDDLRSPKWYKVSDIHFNTEKKTYHISKDTKAAPISAQTIKSIKDTLLKLGKLDLLKN